MIWVTQYFKYREHSHSVTGRNHALPRRGAHVKKSSCWTSQRYEVGMSNVGKNVHLSNPALECWSRAKCQPTGHHKVTWERAGIRISDCEIRPCSEMSGESMARWGMFLSGDLPCLLHLYCWRPNWDPTRCRRKPDIPPHMPGQDRATDLELFNALKH